MHWTAGSWNTDCNNMITKQQPKGMYDHKDVQRLIDSNEQIKEKLQDLMNTDFWDWKFAARHTIAHVLSFHDIKISMPAINSYISQFKSKDELQIRLWTV